MGVPGTCLANRIAMAAVAGYLLAALTGNVEISWAAAVLCGGGVVVWWRVRGARTACGASCVGGMERAGDPAGDHGAHRDQHRRGLRSPEETGAGCGM